MSNIRYNYRLFLNDRRPTSTSSSHPSLPSWSTRASRWFSSYSNTQLRDESLFLQREINTIRSQLSSSSGHNGLAGTKEDSPQRIERDILQTYVDDYSPIAIQNDARSLESEIEIQKGILTNLRAESDAFAEQLKSLREQISQHPDPELPAKIAACESEIEDLTKTREQLTGDRERLRAERAELKAVRAIARSREGLKAELKAAQERLEVAERELAKLDEEEEEEEEEVTLVDCVTEVLYL